MKCEVYSAYARENLLEEYLDEELAPEDHGRVSDHLITCASCAETVARLRAEQELFGRYDREIEVSPALWNGIEERISVSEASHGWWMKVAAVLILTIGLGSVYLFSKKEETPIAAPLTQPDQILVRFTLPTPEKKKRITKRIQKPIIKDNPGVLSSELAYLDIDDQDTVNHIEQTQNLLLSIRNVPVSDSDEEIDVSYDKALSQRLLNENVVLRRDAEMKAKFPTKTLLADLEPLLIDIANLPDRARPEEVREIKERVQKTEIVAALMEYRDRGTNNR